MKQNIRNGITSCWYCGRSTRDHDTRYCQHIYYWKTGQCNAIGPVIYPKFHRKAFDPTNTKWGPNLHFE